MRRTQRFFLNGAVNALSSLLLRGIGMGFSVYLARRIGADGIGLFSLVMSVYSLAVTFAASGINLGTTRIVAEEYGNCNLPAARRALKSALCYAAFFGSLACVLLYCLSPLLGQRWLCDARTVPALRLLAFSLPPLAFSNVCSGYFTAKRHAYKNALFGILSECVRIAFAVALLLLPHFHGMQGACLALAAASTAAESICAVFCVFLLIFELKRETRSSPKMCSRGVTRRLLRVSLPIALTAYVRAALLTVEHILIPLGLRRSGAQASAALAAYGTVHGMVLPVILFPLSFLSAFAALLVPELAEYHVRGDKEAIRRLCSRSCTVTLWLSFGVCGIFLSFSVGLGTVLYDSKSAGQYLYSLALLVPLMYFDHIVDAMLKGLDEQFASMRYNIIDAALCVAAVWLLLPRFGIAAYLWILIGSELFNLSLSASRLFRVVKISFQPMRLLVLPILCCAGALGITRFLMRRLDAFFSYEGWALFAHIGASFVLYFVLMRLCGCIRREDVDWALHLFFPQRGKKNPQNASPQAAPSGSTESKKLNRQTTT